MCDSKIRIDYNRKQVVCLELYFLSRRRMEVIISKHTPLHVNCLVPVCKSLILLVRLGCFVEQGVEFGQIKHETDSEQLAMEFDTTSGTPHRE